MLSGYVASPFDRGSKPDAHSPGILGPVPQDVRTTGLTYEPFYGLKEKPFSLTSDARFFYQSRSHAPAFDDLLNAIKRRESLTVLTGDIGTGKTTLCRAVLQSLDRKTFSAFVTDPFASREELLKVLLTDFGVASIEDLTSGRLRDASRTELSYLLYEFLGTLAPLQAFAVVFIDEAQNLSLPLLEEIRILSDADGQLQVVLVGQLEFREKLRLPQMRQLEQRVSVHCRLEPLDVAGVAGYISHRLHRAGGSADRVNFSGDAVETIYDLSGGIPRVINKLCDRALFRGHLRRAATIDAPLLRNANSDAVPPPSEPVIAAVVEAVIAPPMPPAPVIEDVDVAPPPRPAAAQSPDPIVAARPVIPPPPPAPVGPPVTAPPEDVAAPRAPDSVDVWLAGIEDKAADAAKALAAAAARQQRDDPAAWRERWTPNDLAVPLEQQRPRYRIRIATGGQVAQREAIAGTGSRQFAAILITTVGILFVAFAGPSVVRGAARLASNVSEAFSPPPLPTVPPLPSVQRVLPSGPRVPDGPY
jgi:type II secretory pathway predicted ATPase ExeA